MKRKHKIILIAGPNGAGKTTFARQFLPQEADCAAACGRKGDRLAAMRSALMNAGRREVREILRALKKRLPDDHEETTEAALLPPIQI